MTRISTLVFGLSAAVLLLWPAAATQPNVLSFGCIFASSCIGGALESYAPGTVTPGSIVSVGGYYALGDGGGGTFVVIGAQGTSSTALCNNYSSSSATGKPGTSTITFNSSALAAGLVVGELVSGSGTLSGATVQVQPGSEIASIAGPLTGQTSVTLTLALTGTATTSIALNNGLLISGNNTGTIILDGNSSNKNCYQKTDYRGDPHEWGAYGDGALNASPAPHDDTQAIQYWLGAYGNPVNLPGGTPPANFGPWRPTIPGTYLVSSPLICPPNATIQGDENETNNGSGTTPNPRVNFLASATFNGMTASYPLSTGNYDLQSVFAASAFCRLSGIGISGNAFDLQTTGTSNGMGSISVAAKTDSFGNTIQVGNAVYAVDSTGNPISGLDGTVVTSAPTGTGPYTMSVSQNIPSATSDTFFFFGPDAVDILDGANTVTIDGFTLLQNGRYDLFCGINAPGLHAVTQLRVQNTHLQTAMQHGMYFPTNCDNLRLMDNNVSQAGTAATTVSSNLNAVPGDGIYFGTTEGSIEGGIIQDSSNAGIRLSSASQVSITGIAILENGSQNVGGDAGAGIAIDHSTFGVTICNNHIAGNGGIENPDPAQIYFSGSTNNIDNINLCGNVYNVTTPTKRKSNASIAPWYIYDADNPSALTNIHIYESPEQPGVSIFSPNAKPLLQAAATPQFTANQISGFTLSNDTPSSQVIDITAGSAADSTNSTLITLPPPSSGTTACSINLGSSTNGLNALDSGAIAKNTTYFIYVVSPAKGKTAASCIASASTSLAPAFTASSFTTSTGYIGSLNGGTLNGGSGSNTVYNVNPSSSGNASPINGIAVGDAVWGAAIPTGTTIAGFSADTEPSTQPTVSSTSGTTVTLSCAPATCSSLTIYEGMAIQDFAKCLKSGTYITDTSLLSSMNEIGVSAICSGGMSSGDQLGISGAQQVVLSANTTAQHSSANITVATAYYRLVGAVYTDGNMPPDVVNFEQVGDTYNLITPIHDIHKTNLNTSATTATLGGVPSGISVEALGRCAGGTASSYVILYPGTIPLSLANVPSGFSGASSAPGYAVTSTSTPPSAFNYRLYTDTSARVVLVASGTMTPLDCVTDGWVFHR